MTDNDHPKPGEGQPLAAWESELLEQDELMWLIIPKLPTVLCDCENRESCPGIRGDATALAAAIMAAGWTRSKAATDGESAWPCANFGAPWTCLIPPDHTTVLTRCSFCVDQVTAAVALTPEEIERLAGRQS